MRTQSRLGGFSCPSPSFPDTFPNIRWVTFRHLFNASVIASYLLVPDMVSNHADFFQHRGDRITADRDVCQR